MQIVTWNVNSVRARQERLLRWLAEHQPDVLCLQELKAPDDQFPHQAVQALGYHAAVHGQKTYNGVAILARTPPQDVRCGLDDGEDDPQARLISADVAGVRVLCAYVPNGSEPDSEKYVYKKRWLQRLRSYLERHHQPDQPLVLCGDFNIAPEAADAAHPEAWLGTVLYCPEMTAALAQLASWGLQDAFRRVRPEPGLYSWWDYRMLGFQKNDGLRIDHVFATAPLAALARDGFMDRLERKGEQPSDHVPVGVDFAWPA